MKLCKVEELKGGEILSRDVITPEFRVLLSEGTKLRVEYIEKMKNLGITQVHILEEDTIPTEEVVLLKSEIENFFKDRVKSILEKQYLQPQ